MDARQAHLLPPPLFKGRWCPRLAACEHRHQKIFRSTAMLRSTVRVVCLMVTLFAAQPAGAAETVTIGTVGQGSIANWPGYIATAKGFFDAEGIKPDFVYTPSNTGLVQQVAAGSVDVALSSGLVDPIRAID